MSASVARGFADCAWDEQPHRSASLLVAPSAIMAVFCLGLRSAVPANLAYHAFMLCGIFAHGWSLSIRRNDARHREGRAGRRRPLADHVEPATLGWAMFLVGVGLYVACRLVSRPGEYLGVDRARLRATLDDFGVKRLDEMVVFAVYFSLLNPWLEEVFWRQVVRWRLRLEAKKVVGARKPTAAARVAAACRHADAFSAVAYSAYHSVIISQLMPPWFNLGVAFPFLAGLAQVLNRVADCPRLGVGACVALHTGLDASAAFWILDLRFGILDGVFGG